MKHLTPQELIDIPGAGRAEKHLRDQGQWDDKSILDGETEYKITVKVTGYYDPMSESQYFDVIATSEDEAKDMAEELSDFDHIDDLEIITVKEPQS